MANFKSIMDRPKIGEVENKYNGNVFTVSGWAACSSLISYITISINGVEIDVETRIRPDVEKLYSMAYTYITGYVGKVHKSGLFICGNNRIVVRFFGDDRSLLGQDHRTIQFNTNSGSEVKPYFLGIGAQKAGTTWLYENLSVNSSVYFPKKEVHFFNRPSELSKGIGHYYGLFNAGAGLVCGEVTPEYSFLNVSQVEYIRKYLPGIKIVYILRNPIERSWSGHMMHSLHTLKKKYEDMTREELLLPLIDIHSGVYKMSDYYTNLQTWLSVYPKEDILIEFNDNIKSEPVEVLKRVMAHINVPIPRSFEGYPTQKLIQPNFVDFYDSKIPKPEIPREFVKELRRVYIPMIKKLKTIVDSNILDSWVEWGLK